MWRGVVGRIWTVPGIARRPANGVREGGTVREKMRWEGDRGQVLGTLQARVGA